MKTGDAKPPNYRATTGAKSAGPLDSTDEIGLSARSENCSCDEEVDVTKETLMERANRSFGIGRLRQATG